MTPPGDTKSDHGNRAKKKRSSRFLTVWHCNTLLADNVNLHEGYTIYFLFCTAILSFVFILVGASRGTIHVIFGMFKLLNVCS